MTGGYAGPAPEPTRRMTLGDETNPGDGPTLNQTYEPNVDTLTPGIDPVAPQAQQQPVTLSSPPPPDPDAAASLASLESRLGELVQALGNQRSEYEQRMQEQQLRYEAMLASIASAPPAPIFTSEDTDSPVTVAQLNAVLNQFGSMQQAMTIRATAGISPQEEAQVLQTHPYLQNVPEPKKSEFLRQAVLLQRKASAAPPNGDSRTTQASSVPQSPRVTRPASRTVPTPENAPQVGFLEEPAPVNVLAQAQQEYAAAAQLKDPKARNMARKRAMEKAAVAQGISPEALTQSSWKMR